MSYDKGYDSGLLEWPLWSGSSTLDSDKYMQIAMYDLYFYQIFSHLAKEKSEVARISIWRLHALPK